MPFKGYTHRVGCSILAGGRNARMGGENKAFLKIDNIPMIERIIAILKEISDEILLITNSPGDYHQYEKDCCIITDRIKGVGPLAGIHAGLLKTRKEALFFTACDMPFLHNALILRQINCFNQTNCDAVVPRRGSFIEPLHAVYKKGLNEYIDQYLEEGKDCSIRGFLKKVRVCYLDLEDTPAHRRVFKNVNTQEDLEGLGGSYAGEIKGMA